MLNLVLTRRCPLPRLIYSNLIERSINRKIFFISNTLSHAATAEHLCFTLSDEIREAIAK